MDTYIEHDGYKAQITHIPTDGYYVGRIINVRKRPVTFRVYDPGDAQVMLREAVEGYLNDCAARGEEPER
jgi:predicted HicB family RNase H-like nuclease